MSKEPRGRAHNGEHDGNTGGSSARATGADIGGDARARAGESETTSNEVDLEKTRDVPKNREDKLSERNREGHEKNLEKIAKAHEGNEGEAGSDEFDGQVAGAAPGLGRADNGNTPRVNKDGSKSWGPPGVAGAVK